MNDINRNPESEKLPGMSVLFPAYNERGNICALVQRALEMLPAMAQRFDIFA